MIFHPAVIALLSGSVLITCMLLYAAYYGVAILRKWDIGSGSGLQLNLERKTYLISTIMSYMFCFHLVSLFLFIFTADKLSALFVGAMCAAGALNINDYGYPAIILKMTNFILAGVWLIMNYVDNKAYDYPLIKKKYLLLLIIAPLISAETVVQGAYFLDLKTDVITSCCGSLFSVEDESIAAGLSAFPPILMKWAFYLSMSSTVAAGINFYRTLNKSAVLFSLMSLSAFIISVASIISFISLYFYELPTHHCPFCILRAEYHNVGYVLYGALLGGAVAGTGTDVLTPFRNIPSLSNIIPHIQKKLVIITVALYSLFTMIITARMVFSDFRLEGY